jgi:hypothetical protein
MLHNGINNHNMCLPFLATTSCLLDSRLPPKKRHQIDKKGQNGKCICIKMIPTCVSNGIWNFYVTATSYNTVSLSLAIYNKTCHVCHVARQFIFECTGLICRLCHALTNFNISFLIITSTLILLFVCSFR